MFKTLRHKLLFWFLLFISTNFVIIFINQSYLSQREEIAEVVSLLEETHELLLEDYKNQLNFFTHETKNHLFFEFGTSHFIDHHKTLFTRINEDLDLIGSHEKILKSGLGDEVKELAIHLHLYDSIFFELVDLIRERGYKDYKLIGHMRASAHRLENEPQMNQILILNLRRYEKDYLMRHENIYLRRHNQVAKRVKAQIKANRRINSERKQELLTVLESYLDDFHILVAMDKQIGIFNNSGVKRALDEQEEIMAAEFLRMLELADSAKEEQFNRLRVMIIIITIVFIGLGGWSSFLISRRITTPLTELTSYITRFVQSKFTFTEEKKSGRVGNDEIGKLTLNFNVMRDKIIEQLQFFKQKVEERTEELADANKRLREVNKANKRFVPNEFLHYLKKSSIEEISLGDHIEQEMTIMFSDIRGFTRFSEKLTPQENFDFINAYLNAIVPQVREHKGFVDKYIGDSVMALFPDSVEQAIDSAIDSQECVRRFNAERESAGKESVGVGIGIHTGSLILGTIGEPERMETTVISDAVNTASRVEGLSAIYGASIVISQAVFDKIEDVNRYDTRFLDAVKVKGKERVIEVYEVLNGLAPEIYELKLQTNRTFQMGIHCFKEQKFEEAQELFREVLVPNPADFAALNYLQRCDDLITKGVPRHWHYAEKLAKKK